MSKTLATARKAGSRSKTKASAISVENYRDNPLYPRVVRAVEDYSDMARSSRRSTAGRNGASRTCAARGLAERRYPLPRAGDQLQPQSTFEVIAETLLLRTRPESHPVDDGLYALGQRAKEAAPLHQNGQTGDHKLEAAYARHFIWIGKGPFHLPNPQGGIRPERQQESSDE